MTDDEDLLSSDDDDSFLREVAGMDVVAPPVALAANELVGRFRILGAAGSGGMGTVYRAVEEGTARHVAIKVLHRRGNAQRRFQREGAILDELSHPAIVRYVARGELEGGAPYLVMDWIEGETLETRLRGGGLSVGETVAMVRRIAEGLGVAHARGVVHRDVKPSNLLFDGSEPARVVIVDFGIARANAFLGSLTETGAVVGTPSYMAPEQVRGVREVGPPADVFALGCVLHECLTGKRAFEARRLLALRAKVLLADPAPTTSVPALDAIVARMLAKDPAARPRNGAEVAALLAALPEIDPALRPRRDAPRAAGLQKLRSLVIATGVEALDPRGSAPLTVSSLSTLRGVVAASSEAAAASIELLPDGAMIALLEGPDPAELAARAVACARSLRAAAPEDVVGIATSDGDPGTAIDDLVGSLARDAMAALFAGALPAGAIRIDARTDALLDPAVPRTRVKNTSYLTPAG